MKEDLPLPSVPSESWETEAVHSEGVHTSIALDISDNVHIKYFAYSNQDLKYGTNK
jgi:hypothetical protein